LVAETLYLPLLPLDLLLQFFAAALVGVPCPGGTPIRRCLFLAAAASRCRIHPPYVKRFCAICPAKSMGVSAEFIRKVRYHHIHTQLRQPTASLPLV
jgi:hypothetical protein